MSSRKLTTLALLTLSSHMLWGATDTWSGAVDNIWTSPGNWSPGVPNNHDTLIFPATPTRFTIFYGSITNNIFPSITISSTAAEPYTFNSTSNFIELNGSPAALNNSSTGGSTTTINGPINLGSSTVITQGVASDSLTINGTISGGASSTLTLDGGTLTLNGSNTYNGNTVISAGTVAIMQGTAFGAAGNTVTLDAGTTLQMTASGMSSRHPIILTSGTVTFDTQGNNFTINSVISGAGKLNKISSGVLTLSGAGGSNTYSGNTHISAGTVAINNGGAFGANNSTVTMEDGTRLTALSTGTITNHPFIFPSGQPIFNTELNTLTLNAASHISGAGGLLKTGHGTLIFMGNHSYTGNTLVSVGQLTVNGILTSSVTVDPGAILKGTGRIEAPVIVKGTLQPGNSIGTLTTTALVTFDPGSTFTVEISPTAASLLDVIGAGVTINPGVSLVIAPNPGTYLNQATYTIITTTAGVTDTFSSVTNPFPLFKPSVTYTTDTVILTFDRIPFASLVPSGNAGAVARCLDKVSPTSGGDINTIIAQLLFSPNTSLLKAALVQLQPSMFKDFALAQQNTTIRMRSTFTKHADFLHQNRCLRNALRAEVCDSNTRHPDCTQTGESTRTWTFWADAIGDISHQSSTSSEKIGYESFGGGGVFGADYQLLDNFYLGFSSAYSYTDLEWKRHAGSGDIQSIYGTVYGTYSLPHFYVNSSLTGAYNNYFGKRKIKFFATDRRARSTHGGGEGAAYLGMGGLFQVSEFSFNPYGSADFIYLHEKSFREHGANSLDLRVGSSNSNYFRGEAGLAINGCFTTIAGKWIPNIKAGVVREWRFLSEHYRTELVGAGCSFIVSGLRPDRTLFAPGASFTALLLHERLGLSLSYDGEFGRHYGDQNLSLQANYSF